MYLKIILFLMIFLNSFSLFSQTNIDVNNINIVRDEWGIPHIFTETDAEAVYGIGWAQCEDNFNMIQENIAMTKGIYGSIKGLEGVMIDYIVKLFEIENYVKIRYEQDINDETEALLQAYILAINKYAIIHPEEVVHKGIFPLNTMDVLNGYIFNFLIKNHTIIDVIKIAGNRVELFNTGGNLNGTGSNAMAFNHNITSDEKTYLVANPHQPVDGPGNFWEVSVHSKEGYEFFGTTLSAGGVTPSIGTNRHLGWTHTTNYKDYSDVFKLEMHPHKKNYYKFDGEWVALEVKKAKLKVKLGPFKFPFTKKYYTSKYGPTLKNKSGYYSFRSNSFYNLRIVEQYYKMGLAKNFDEFWEALEIQSLPAQTITYADDQQNIFHISNGILPIRNEEYNWRKIVPGNTSNTLWSYDEKYSLEDLPIVKNPKCGYVFNCNNSPLESTSKEENPQLRDYPKSMGILSTNTLRAKRFMQLIMEKNNLSFTDIKSIRDDIYIDKTDLSFRTFLNANHIPIILSKYKELANAKVVFDKWNGEMKTDNKQATIFALAVTNMGKYFTANYGLYDNIIPEIEIFNAFNDAQKFLMKNYKTLEVELGRVHKITRGDVEFPMYGSFNTLANSHYSSYKNDKMKCTHGDTYILYAQYGNNGLEELKAINVFGNSNKPNSNHYTDQLEMFVKMELRTVVLENDAIKQLGVMYHPK